LIRRITGVITRPRAAMAAVAHAPASLATWSVILIVWACCGAWLLSTAVGQQALVDERVRSVESLGATVSDAEYAALQVSPPWWVYFSSGGRVLLFPLTTLLVAAVIMVVSRTSGRPATFAQALSVAVHASVVLVLGQLIATPLHYVRESLTTPFNLAAILPLMEAGSVAARIFGSIDVFALWWAGLLALGLSALTGRRARHYAWPIAALFLGFGIVAATLTVAMGGA
jgi:hypothetical protein